MAKRKSNRAARRLFGAFGRLSNTRRITFRVLSDHWSCWSVVCIDQFKPTRRQRRNAKIIKALLAKEREQAS